jgi:hypothetical protein
MEDLDLSPPTIYQHPIAGAQAHGGITTADYRWDTQLAGDNGRVRKRRAYVGDDRRSEEKERRPGDVGQDRDQDLPFP